MSKSWDFLDVEFLEWVNAPLDPGDVADEVMGLMSIKQSKRQHLRKLLVQAITTWDEKKAVRAKIEAAIARKKAAVGSVQ